MYYFCCTESSCCTQAFLSCGERGLLFSTAHGLLMWRLVLSQSIGSGADGWASQASWPAVTKIKPSYNLMFLFYSMKVEGEKQMMANFSIPSLYRKRQMRKKNFRIDLTKLPLWKENVEHPRKLRKRVKSKMHEGNW